MTRRSSKNRQQGRSPMVRANRRGNPVIWGDWIVPSTSFPSSGSTGAALGANAWGTATGYSAGVSGIALVLSPSQTVGANTLVVPREFQIDEVMGSVWVNNGQAASTVIGVGIYVSEFSETGGVWQMLDPLNPIDAQRDDWLFLRNLQMPPCPTSPSSGTQISAEIRLGLPAPEVIGEGECLMLVINVTALCQVTLGVRSRVSRSS